MRSKANGLFAKASVKKVKLAEMRDYNEKKNYKYSFVRRYGFSGL